GGRFRETTSARGRPLSCWRVIAPPLAAYCLVGEAGDLFGDQTNQEHDDCCAEQQGTHVCKAPLDCECPCIPSHAHSYECSRNGREQLQRRIQRRDPEDDQQETKTVPDRADVALADPCR